jgi:hypothetical protein
LGVSEYDGEYCDGGGGCNCRDCNCGSPLQPAASYDGGLKEKYYGGARADRDLGGGGGGGWAQWPAVESESAGYADQWAVDQLLRVRGRAARPDPSLLVPTHACPCAPASYESLRSRVCARFVCFRLLARLLACVLACVLACACAPVCACACACPGAGAALDGGLGSYPLQGRRLSERRRRRRRPGQEKAAVEAELASVMASAPPHTHTYTATTTTSNVCPFLALRRQMLEGGEVMHSIHSVQALHAVRDLL